MRVLILGGTSFTGLHTVRRLVREGHEVASYHSGGRSSRLPESVHQILGERSEFLRNRKMFANFAPDVVLDMRAMTEADAKALVRIFTGITKRLVVISSDDVYRAYGRLTGKEPGELEAVPLTEDSPVREVLYPHRSPKRQGWVNDYDKLLVERTVMASDDLSATILRVPIVYGPEDDLNSLHIYVKRMQDRRPAIVLEAEFGRWRASRVYTENLAHAITLAITNDSASGRIYNVGEASPLTWQEWIRALGNTFGWTGEIHLTPAAELPTHMVDGLNKSQDMILDSSRMRKELGYSEEISLEEGFRRSIEWELQNPPRYLEPSEYDYAAEDAILARSTTL